MATVVITCFLFTIICFYKMDADIEKTPRDLLSRREKRWSMNSQRLEEILAELMKPISDVRRSFDTDLCALLEEYLTEAGLHALDAAEDDDEEPLSVRAAAGAVAAAHTNFAELAMLLQQSASIYGRKVDFLYQHVLAVSDALHSSTQEECSQGSPQGEEGGAGRRRRRASGGAGGGGFGPLELEMAAAARREEGPARPPPTLPRLYIELEPRAPSHRDLRLADRAGEPIGLLSDYHVLWGLREGLLVDELDEGGGGGGGGAKRSLRPIPLAELQAAIAAAAPAPLPPLPHCHSPPPPPASPLPPLPPPPACSTPLPAPPAPPAAQDKMQRKRKSDVKVEDVFEGSLKFSISKGGLRKLRRQAEWAVPAAWAGGVLRARREAVRAARRTLRAARPPDYYAFCGWSLAAGRAARTAALRARQALAAVLRAPGGGAGAGGGSAGPGDDLPDSEDDGFFELSDLADSEELSHNFTNETGGGGGDAACTADCSWASWSLGVAARAAAAEARGAVDVRALAERVLACAPAAPLPAAPFDSLLRAAARAHSDVSRLFLASLFLANSGNVELVGAGGAQGGGGGGGGGALGGVALRVLSRDAALYAAAADSALAPTTTAAAAR